MNVPQIYILIALIALAAIAVVMLLTGKKMKRSLSRLSLIAFLFIVAGIAFGENRLAGYGFMIVGLVLAIIDMFLGLEKGRSGENVKYDV